MKETTRRKAYFVANNEEGANSLASQFANGWEDAVDKDAVKYNKRYANGERLVLTRTAKYP